MAVSKNGKGPGKKKKPQKPQKATGNMKPILKAAIRDVKGKKITDWEKRQLAKGGVTGYKPGEKNVPTVATKQDFADAMANTRLGQKAIRKAGKAKTPSPTTNYIKNTRRFDYLKNKRK
jgi:hypothetical protein